jgi:hypothetical protein
MRVTQGLDIERLTKLAMWLWVRVSAPCIDGGGTANARRVPDVDRVRFWNRVMYAIIKQFISMLTLGLSLV